MQLSCLTHSEMVDQMSSGKTRMRQDLLKAKTGLLNLDNPQNSTTCPFLLYLGIWTVQFIAIFKIKKLEKVNLSRNRFNMLVFGL